jgi:predicted  nucleic acid-binding Zn-ribbon protein
MDINTMLSAAYDAYEKVKMEATAMQDTIKELQEENDALKKKLEDQEESL